MKVFNNIMTKTKKEYIDTITSGEDGLVQYVDMGTFDLNENPEFYFNADEIICNSASLEDFGVFVEISTPFTFKKIYQEGDMINYYVSSFASYIPSNDIMLILNIFYEENNNVYSYEFIRIKRNA